MTIPSHSQIRVALYHREGVFTPDVPPPSRRLAILRQNAHAWGWTVQGEYVEDAHTTINSRFRELIDAGKEGLIDGAYFWSLNHFCAMGAAPAIRLLDQLIAAGLWFRSETEPEVDTFGSNRNTVEQIITTLADREHRQLSLRSRRAIETAREAGIKLGRPRRTVDVDRLQDLRRQGVSIREIARRLGLGDGTVRRAIVKTDRAS